MFPGLNSEHVSPYATQTAFPSVFLFIRERSVVDPDPTGSAKFCRIRIVFSIQGITIRSRPIRIGIIPVK